MRVSKTMALAAVAALSWTAAVKADLSVDFNLGSISTTQNLVGDTTGANNNGQRYTGTPGATWTYNNGEHVYQFTLTDTYNLGITSNTTGGVDHDHILLSDLITTNDGTWEVSNSLIGFVDENGSLGTFGPGTYYLAIDGFGTTANAAEGAYDVDLTLDLFVPTCLGTDVLCEEFEGGIPASWSTVDNLGGAGTFGWDTTADTGRANETGGSGFAANMDSDFYNGSPNTAPYDGSLITPSFAIAGGYELSFDYRHRNLGSNFEAILHTSGSGDVSLVSLLNAGNAGGSAGDSFSLDLSAFAGETATVEFRYSGDSWDWYSQVDNVRVTPEPGTAMLLALGVVGLIRRRR
ncbi:MAG: PEP-CTERM sorting domain-containing protein [Phycisphaerales bacterium]|nr:PEP-CTERM sorting domain-containing protein [Phycisphaerales bacterium]MCB9855956.1 PEP-CTERM sorting domain-containing protein [Phycisphaerales bacterium]MCB9864063.1 PEP-CTERM sorting domain-containing protein [Phycisphaerales bacterium]